MKVFFASFVSTLLISNLAFAVSIDMAIAIYAGLAGKIDAIEECTLVTEDNKTVVRGSKVNAMIACYMGMGTKYDDDRYYSVIGVIKGNGTNMTFTSTQVKQIQYE